jgi:hypothetical protein
MSDKKRGASEAAERTDKVNERVKFFDRKGIPKRKLLVEGDEKEGMRRGAAIKTQLQPQWKYRTSWLMNRPSV